MDVDAVQVDLFGITCNTDTPDANGNLWSVAEIRGWESPEQRSRFVEPTALHGSIGSEFYANGRELVIIGDVKSPTQAAAWDVFNLLSSSMPGLLGSGDVVVHEPDVAKSLTVVQSGPPRPTPPLGRAVDFQLTVLAEYPWKVAVGDTVDVTIAAGATVPFTATGNAPAAEIVVTTTSSGTVNLTASGLSLTASTVPSGTVFDSMPGAFSVTGPSSEDLFSAMLPGFQWPAVVPGSNSFVNSGTADVVLSYYPTYA